MTNVSSTDVFLIASTEAEPLRKNWGWMVAFGVLLALAGFIALGSVLLATIASVIVVGVSMIFSGIAEIIYGVALRSWKKFFLWVLLGLLYVIGGVRVSESSACGGFPHAVARGGALRIGAGADIFGV